MPKGDSQHDPQTPDYRGGYKSPRTPFGCATFTDGKGNWSPRPTERVHWAMQFRQWIVAQWFDSSHPLPQHFAGPNAQNPALAPLLAIASRSGVFDLSDPTIYAFWLEYLSEHPQRLKAWKRFERENGPCDALYWENEASKAWRARAVLNHKPDPKPARKPKKVAKKPARAKGEIATVALIYAAKIISEAEADHRDLSLYIARVRAALDQLEARTDGEVKDDRC